MTSPSSSFPSPSTSGTALLDPDPVEVRQHHPALHPSNLFDVEGLVVVITGGGTGIGLMMAKALENNGATVYIVGRRMDVLQVAARENNNFDKIIPIEGDITNRDSLLTIVETVRSRHGYIDLLVNNAGIARNLYPHPLPALWDTGSLEDFAETFLTNVTAVYYTTVAFLDLLHQGNIRRQRLSFPTMADGLSRPPYHTSQVLSVSSSGSFRLDSRVLSPSYTLSKSACTHLGKLLANLLAPWGIRSNVLAPGVWPKMTTCPTPNFRLDPIALADTVPLRRVGTQEDMAGTILFLASQAGAYVNGAVWLVDGGRIGTVASTY
ncbi:hypothetical protein GALMADRAFT_57695 [Galerina marginata CBS 339.88]|uniref:Uncharacterized protein n=1 Tax=Galerina marginata (strain CBS 339.88) TaxID=685588 RepID=A0A067TU35_GALM3|nr:hypothetical protein GALMADRAFT_57695 [Galerina marginata CBS 339.88]